MSDLRKRIAFAISDPGHAGEGLKGERTLTEWQTDAVMRVVEEALQAEREKNAKIADSYECSLVEYAGGLSAQTFYEGGVNDASAGIAAAIRKGGE